jgi:hypothetical protein
MPIDGFDLGYVDRQHFAITRTERISLSAAPYAGSPVESHASLHIKIISRLAAGCAR